MGRWEVNANKLLATKESAHMYAERLTELATALGFDGWLEKLAHGLTWIQKMRYSVLSVISSTHFPFDLYSINAFYSRQACLLPTPKGASCANYARCVNQILQNLTNMQACLLPTPKGASCANNARCVNQILQNLTNMQLN
ncbi:uncharacterized protein LOC114263894 [Camellia sinensis]|uniref:uncharacterized protein LOC114263894 n=1 Tax=Camellia sinensis TaxID=4442 RepID=UPI0010364B87|nr:uncharacterized protein LOC114263894 [Camellia sinensis]